MSAWIVSQDHIDLMVTVALRIAEFNPRYVDVAAAGDALGTDLWEENHRSVNHRYSESTPTPAYSWTPVADVEGGAPLVGAHLVQILKAVHCYDYQTCEHPEWTSSKAFYVSRTIEQWAERQLGAMDWPEDEATVFPDHPPRWRGMDDAAWGWDRENGFKASHPASPAGE
ncbi:hypothetical protein SPF06_18525 [Sinomonas sp. JGH33]|uniref:Uncharacterized protein n=1 Tax=Sinomonas terricola TaxID=3110330 RepID=A0ABU5TAM4_9MICC|nr:hypothetical protein [Sinomonas sp. JGH33]MEA5456723.1 hypothetical protein [Sinomonas sp. JGH33]